MSTLYITQPDAILNKTYEACTVSLKQPDGSWEKQAIPAQMVEQVVLMGNPQVVRDAFVYALALGMPIHYLSSFGIIVLQTQHAKYSCKPLTAS